MPLTHPSRCLPGLRLAATLLVFVLAAACSRRSDPEAGGTNVSSRPQQIPFHQDSDSGPGAYEAGQAALQSTKGENDLPFRSTSRTLPVGTLLTVRLEKPISTSIPADSRAFTAVLDTPVRVEGATVWPHGATTTGRLESARAAPRVGTGYVCLTLESIAFGGKITPLQTSNLFVKGRVEEAQAYPSDDARPEHRASAVRIEKGHRLTFRLTQAVVLSTSEEETSGPSRSESR